MFANKVVDSDMFLEMPLSTQALYFHLSMKSDDDGFVSNPKRILRTIGCCEDDMRILVLKRFIIPFESGIVVIRHWLINNYIRSDRYKPTIYLEEKAMLIKSSNDTYEFGIPVVDQTDTQYRVVEKREEENSEVEVKASLGKEILTYDAYNKLLTQYDKTLLDKIIEKILRKPYYNCLNEQKISEWCEEAKNCIIRTK